MGAVQTGHGTDLLGLGLPGAPKVVLQPEPWAPPWQLEQKGPDVFWKGHDQSRLRVMAHVQSVATQGPQPTA